MSKQHQYIKEEVQKGVTESGADFGIVTDPANPDKAANLDNLPTNAYIMLNQYNVFAYKKIIRQIEIAPDRSNLAQGKFKVDTVGYGVAKKISKSGKYLGVKAQYNFEDKEAKAFVQYMY